MQTIPEDKVPMIREFYEAKQYSAREIADLMNYSIHAVYYIMRKYRIQRRSTSENSAIQFKKKPASFEIKQKLTTTERQLKIASCMLYWAEGYKTNKSPGIDMANSDPDMQRMFMRFLRDVCNITESRLKIQLYSHSASETNKQISYWSKVLQIPKTQFTKPYINPSVSLEKKDKMPYGLVHIRYYDKKLLKQIMSWISEYKQNLR